MSDDSQSTRPMPPPPRNQKPCIYYITNSCNKGAACPFAHIGPPPEGPPHLICRYYSTGSCKFGGLCRNFHLEGSGLEVETRKIHCVFWEAGKCNKGRHCNYVHERLTSGAKSCREQLSRPNTSLSVGKPVTRPTTLHTNVVDIEVRLFLFSRFSRC